MAETSKTRPVWTWRQAIATSGTPPLTRLVCHAIACHLSDAGKGWAITVKELMAETGMSNGAISAHLKNAVAAGLLEIERETDARGYRIGTIYKPKFPEECRLADAPADMQIAHVEDESDEIPENEPETLNAPDASGGLDVRGPRGPGESLNAPGESLDARRTSPIKNFPSFPSFPDSPQPPSGTAAGGREGERIKKLTRKERSLAEIASACDELARIDGGADFVAMVLRPVLEARRTAVPVLASAFRPVVEWAADWGLEPEEARAIRDAALADRDTLLRPNDVQAAMEAVRKRRPYRGVLVSRNSDATYQQYHAWLRHAETSGADPEMRSLAYKLRQHGAWTVPSPWPPRRAASRLAAEQPSNAASRLAAGPAAASEPATEAATP